MKKLTRFIVVATLIFSALTATVGWSIGTALSALLTTFVLVLVRDGIDPASPARSILTIAGLYWGLSYVSNLIEALFFGVIPPKSSEIAAIIGLLVAFTVASALEFLTPRQVLLNPRLDPTTEPQTAMAPGLLWRIPLLAFAFFVTYIAAGIAIQPWIMSFYAHRHLPSLPQLLFLQLCRGLFDLACIYPVFSQWRASRTSAVFTSACIFTVLCGWAPLLLPNQFLPAPIRLAHAFEMGASGIVFGAITALLLLRSTRTSAVKDLPA